MERQGLAPQPRDEARENELVQQCWSEELHINRSELTQKTFKDLRTLPEADKNKIRKCIAEKIGES